ncbi:hypothetical protein [Acidilobus sp.]|uniref:hypothetical protein n=1 Tax=Acidilobus sp. TaxID=1872109 RepID=UPI003CFD4550
MVTRARLLAAVAASLIIASLGALAAMPAVVADARYYYIGVGLVSRVITPTYSKVIVYPPMAVPEVLLGASAVYIAFNRRARAAYLALAALSYYFTAALEVAEGLRGLGGLTINYGPSSALVVPRASVSLNYASVALLAASAGAAMAASAWGEVRKFMEAAEAMARRRFGVGLEELRRRSPGLARAVELYSRYSPGYGEGRSHIYDEGEPIREVADREARRTFGVGIDELERTKPWAAREIMRRARYMRRRRA